MRLFASTTQCDIRANRTASGTLEVLQRDICSRQHWYRDALVAAGSATNQRSAWPERRAAAGKDYRLEHAHGRDCRGKLQRQRCNIVANIERRCGDYHRVQDHWVLRRLETGQILVADQVALVSQMFYRAISGYVHGAYVHIMELHSAETPGHYLMLGTRGKITEAVDFVSNYVYRAMLAIECFVKVSGRADLLPSIELLRTKFSGEFDLLPQKPVRL
jgi:hypothetical protein